MSHGLRLVETTITTTTAANTTPPSQNRNEAENIYKLDYECLGYKTGEGQDGKDVEMLVAVPEREHLRKASIEARVEGERIWALKQAEDEKRKETDKERQTAADKQAKHTALVKSQLSEGHKPTPILNDIKAGAHLHQPKATGQGSSFEAMKKRIEMAHGP